jgi:voltage-dependent calcium channel L type alpha-1D
MLDFFIVLTAYVEVILANTADTDAVPNIKILRALRTFRALKVVQSVSSLQQVLESIVSAVPYLNNVAKLIVVVIILYGIIGVEFFAGVLQTECYWNDTDTAVDGRRCTLTLGNGGRECSEGQYCKSGVQNPNSGIMSFDNIAISMLTVFQCITLEGWTDVWYSINDVMGGKWSWLYFLTLTVLGSFFILNLVLGVLEGQFSKAGNRIKFQNKMKKKQVLIKIVKKKESIEEYKSWMEKCENADFLIHVAKKGGLVEESAEEQAMYGDGIEHPVKEAILDDADDTGKDRPPPRSICGDKIVHSNAFLGTIMFFVFANTVLMAADYAHQPDWWTQTLRYCNIGLVVIFTLELFFKLWALGSKLLWRTIFNRFDVLVVIISIIELAVVEAAGMPSLGLSVFRAVRLLRLLKYTNYWKPLRALVTKLTHNMGVIISLLVLVQLMIFIFALLGMQLFGGRVESRSHFNDFGSAYITIFQILTGENWNEVMNDTIVGCGGIESAKGSIASLYFVILILVGDFVILNVFLAIAVDCLDVVLEAIEEQRAERDDALADKEFLASQRKEEQRRVRVALGQEESREEDNDAPVINPEKLIPESSALFIFAPDNSFRIACNNFRNGRLFDPFILFCIAVSSICLAAEDATNPKAEINSILNYFDFAFLGIFAVEMLIKWISLGVIVHKGAYMRDPWNLLDMTAVVASLIAVILTATSDGSGGGSSAVRVLRVIRVLRPLRSVKRIPELQKVVQCLIAAVANITPVVILMVSSLFMFAVIGVSIFKGSFEHCDGDDFRYLNLTECTGDYMFEDNHTMMVAELASSSVDRSGSASGSASGSLDYMSDSALIGMSYGNHTIVNEFMNFDNVANGMLTLFAAATTEGWMATMFNLHDSVGEGATMVENNRVFGPTFYLVFFMLIVSFFMMNLFIGFVIVTYQAASEDEYQDCILDAGDRECVAYVLKAKPTKIWKPTADAGGIRQFCYKMTVSERFNSMVTFMIGLNLITLMMQKDGMSTEYAHILDIMNIIFTGVFIVEAIIKIIGLSFRGYISNRWNVFDFVIVVGSVLDVVFFYSSIKFSVLKLVRAFRLIKLLKNGDTETLLNTFFRSFKELPYVVMLVFLLFFIYAVVGMQIFGRVCMDVEMDGEDVVLIYGEDSSINEHANFTSLFRSLALLFRCATGENWQDVMRDLKLDPAKGECNEFPIDGESSTCGGSFAILYMLSFVLLGSFIVMNLFVAVIVDNFAFLTQDSAEIGANGLEEFSTMWSKYDSNCSGHITLPQLNSLLMELAPPFGLKGCPNFILRKKLGQVRCPIGVKIGTGTASTPEAFTVEFRSVFMGLVRLQKGGVNEDKEIEGEDGKMISSWKDMGDEQLKAVMYTYVSQDIKSLNEAIPSNPPVNACNINTLRSYYQVVRLQKWWRETVRKRRRAAGLDDFPEGFVPNQKHSIMRYTDSKCASSLCHILVPACMDSVHFLCLFRNVVYHRCLSFY